MKSNAMKKLLAGALAAGLLISFTGCNQTPQGKTYDNENDPLVFSTLELDKVFNPFFSTSATDSNIVGMTQLSMLSNDSKGNYAYGDKEAAIVKDLQIKTEGTEDIDQTTTYYFVLKNDVKFSNGSALTIKDVLFNLYVYLDPVYDGSSTIYSTDIVGLKEYRTQSANENEQDNFMKQFQIKAQTRVDALVSAATEILEDHQDLNADSMKTKLQEYVDDNAGNAFYANIVKDYDKALELFKKELETDYSNARNSYEDTTFSDASGKVYKNLFTTDVEMFLYNENYITWNKKEGKLTSSLINDPAALKDWTKEKAIDTVFADKIPDAIEEVVQYWNTATTLMTYLTNEEMEIYAQNTKRTYENISGIQFVNRTAPVTINGVTYDAPAYNSDGSVSSGNEVLSIKINGVDPKAIWNFAFSVAPMYYYSDKAHIDAFDYVANFGVEYMSQTFMDKVVNSPDKIGVPVGAGPYAASKASGGLEGVASGDFYSLGIVYYERNPQYLMGPAKIKKVRYQVVPASQMLNSLYSGQIDFAEPNAKPETITELNGKKSEGIDNQSVQTAGYGYIGINAGKVPSLAVRQAIMHSINTQECVDYYKTKASPVYRSMSLSSWAYPQDATPYYPYIGGKVPANLGVVNPDYRDYVKGLGKKTGDTLTEKEQQDFIVGLVEGAGYTLNGSGIYQKGSSVLKYDFTIAGEENDHPAWNAMFHAAEILNKIGFNIIVKHDPNALQKLAQGDLAVWAAAWGSTIDPDMYQVYHKDSKASSVKNWGYSQILINAGGRYDTEMGILEELSVLIDKGRQTNDQSKRQKIYAQALDYVMKLAVELPTYQRDDLFAYNANKIDAGTLTPADQVSPYKGLTSDLHKISLNTVK